MDFSLSITNILIVITCFTSYLGFTQPDFFEKYKFYPYATKRDGSYIRFLSSGFLHSTDGPWHIVFNMMTLHSLGNIVESIFAECFPYGRLLYLALYLSSIVAADVADYFTHKDNPYYSAIGASGGTSAVVFSFIFFAPWEKLTYFFILNLPAIVLGVLYLIFSTYMAKRGDDNIAHGAHFWGGIYGFVFTCIVAAALRPDLLQHFIEQMTFSRLFQ